MANGDYRRTPNEEQRSRAERMAGRIAEAVPNDNVSISGDEESRYYLEDVYFHSRVFANLYQICRGTNQPFPCFILENEKPIPINFLPSLPFFGPPDRHLFRDFEKFFDFPFPFWRDSFHRYRKMDEIELVGADSALSNFKSHLTNFLSMRFWGFDNFGFFRGDDNCDNEPGGRRISAPPRSKAAISHLTISVRTQNPGLQISASPAYFVHWTYFGAPTTPVSGPILPGRYIFGGRGNLLPEFTIDPAVFDVPPTLDPILMAL